MVLLTTRRGYMAMWSLQEQFKQIKTIFTVRCM